MLFVDLESVKVVLSEHLRPAGSQESVCRSRHRVLFGMPSLGAKKRDMRSHFSPLAVTMKPRHSIRARAAKSGCDSRTASSLSSTTSRSQHLVTISSPLRRLEADAFLRPTAAIEEHKALANVALPQSATLASVVNHLISKPSLV